MVEENFSTEDQKSLEKDYLQILEKLTSALPS